MNLFLGYDTVVQQLLKHGGNVSATNSDGNTALHLALRLGN